MANWVDYALGAANIYSGWRNSQQAKEASDDARDIAQQNLDMQKAAMERHIAIYGSVEENLAKYYQNLSPQKRAAQGIENYNKKYKLAMDKFKANLVSRGLMDSGMELETNLMFDLNRAAAENSIVNQAEQSVKQEQMNFLNMGNQLKTGIQSNQTNAMNTMANIYSNQANQHRQASGRAMQNISNIAANMEDRDWKFPSWFNNSKAESSSDLIIAKGGR